MTQTQVWTIGKLLEWTTEFLRKSGSESARLDAEVLLAHARSCQRIQLYTAFGEEATDAERTAFREMVRRRAEGTPVAYLVGHKEFFSLEFIVNSDCLIPRPETEHLVVAALDWAKIRMKNINGSRPLLIADVCTGSGCVAVAMAKHLSNCELMASDLSSAALKVAESNIAKHSFEDRISLFQGDLLDAMPNSEAKLDMVLSNPPYVSEEEFKQLPKDIREHEPASALLSGPSGFEVTERLLTQAAERLCEGGVVMLESSPMLVPKIEAFLQSQNLWHLAPTVKDFQGHARIIIAERMR
ncbi:MAG: peptide chain release factor N(5)-glutamine methyltransferase [Pirellulaceae bacterium]|nr:peptide chain release factor N(5)-glutamine methyltransferase [Pirellulaceae bacterium]